jgi:hypothetical protein
MLSYLRECHMLAQSLPDTLLAVTAWDDPVVAASGYDPRSDYVERFWLGVLGPSAVWLLRHLAHRFDEEPGGFTVDLADLGASLGLGTGSGRHAPLNRTLLRCCQFRMAHRFSADHVAVRRQLPPLAQHQLRRLPDRLQHEHLAYQPCVEGAVLPPDHAPAGHEPVSLLAARHSTVATAATPGVTTLAVSGAGAAVSDPGPLSSNRPRARQMALSLADAGEDCAAIDAQLRRWRFTAELAAEAARWASERVGVSLTDAEAQVAGAEAAVGVSSPER